MAAKINKSPELDQAFNKEQAVFLVDATGQTTHVVFPVEEARLMFDDYLRREIQLGVEQATRGESEPWNLEATLAEAHRRHADRTKQT